MSGDTDDFQRHITRLLLAAIDDAGFVLAGAGAIRAHGLTNRPTEDIDLFAGPLISGGEFAAAVGVAEQALADSGYEVARLRDHPMFARLLVRTDDDVRLEVDLAANWRADPPVQMSLGPVLSERDAVAGKLSAVYSRGEVRDFLDLDAIRSSGRYSDDELLALGQEHDHGFIPSMLATQLSRIARIAPASAEQYGVNIGAFEAVQERTVAWAAKLRG